jgi:hypothetical protein
VSERRGPPAFARDFPADPRLDALLSAFERGDYAAVRRGAAVLVQDADAGDVQRAAAELRRRTGPDRTMVALLALTAALLVFLASYWMLAGRA